MKLKTDDQQLYDFSTEVAIKHPGYKVIFKSENISDKRLTEPELNITTFYERRHLLEKKTIKYLQLIKIDGHLQY